MDFSKEQIKSLRAKTGAGMLDCKNALAKANGNMEEAIQYLREKGLLAAEKKGSRSTKQGIIVNYIHIGAKLGIMLELNCETDFVAKKKEFAELGKNLAIQIVSNPILEYISKVDIPNEKWENEKKLQMQMTGTSDTEILNSQVEKNLKLLTLLDDYCFSQPNTTIEEYIKEHIALFGENIQINRFCKFSIGQPTILAQSSQEAQTN